MNHRSVISKVSITCAIFFMFFVMGCSAKDTAEIENKVAGDEVVTRTLGERVLARWSALIKRDFGQAYMFQTPAYRSVYDLKHYRKQFGDRVGWISAEVKSIQEKDRVAEVIVNVRYKTLLPFASAAGQNIVESATFLKEKWIQEGGVWFYIKE